MFGHEILGVVEEVGSGVQSVQKGVFRIENYLRGLTVKYSDQFYQVLQEYLAGRKDLAAASREINGYLQQAAADLVAEHGWTDLK